MNILEMIFPKKYDVSDWFEGDMTYHQTHLRQTAMNTVLGWIKSNVALAKFECDGRLNTLLNERTNYNENAIDFRSKLIERLIYDGDVLVLIENSNLYIADHYTSDNSVMREKLYKDITIDGLTLNKQYRESEVLHFNYHNPELKKYIKELDNAYAQLYSRMIAVHMREQQLRVYAKFRGLGNKQEENYNKLKKFLMGLKNSLEKDSVVVAPRQDDYEIEEKSQSFLGRSITEIADVENMYLNNLAKALQLSPVLFNGELADISQHERMGIKNCIKPLLKIIEVECKSKFNTNVQSNLSALLYNSEFEMARDVEKMIGSGVWTIDDVLEKLGKERLNTTETTQRYMTKNIAPIGESE